MGCYILAFRFCLKELGCGDFFVLDDALCVVLGCGFFFGGCCLCLVSFVGSGFLCWVGLGVF